MIKLLPPRASLILRRIRGSHLRELLTAAAPLSINRLLYIGEESAQSPRRLPACFSTKSFSMKHLSGVDRIDERLTRYRLAYVVFCFGEIVHESWVCFDAPLPSQYGFDVRLPVIDRSVTHNLYRGKGIFPYVLNHILHDLKNRRINDGVYVLVSPTNYASIRGIQKAGFKLLAHLKGTRLLGCFITNKSIQICPQGSGLQVTNFLEPPSPRKNTTRRLRTRLITGMLTLTSFFRNGHSCVGQRRG